MMERSVDEEEAKIVTESPTEMKHNLEDEEGRSEIFKDILESTELTISEIKELKGILVSRKPVCEWESERTKLQNENELKKREENGSWFKIIRRIIENIPLAVSEMGKFIDILLEKERACERGAEWVKQMDTPSGEARLPPLPELVLEKIFSCSSLSTKDILSSRLVCRHWLSSATKELRKRICKEFAYTWVEAKSGKYYYQIPTPTQDLKEFLEVMKKSQLLPVASFYINPKYIEDSRQSDETKDFFQIFGPILTHLNLEIDGFRREETPSTQCGLTTYLQQDQQILKKLENLSFSYVDEFCPMTDDARTSLIIACFRSAPNLKKLKFYSEENAVGLLKSLENAPLPHLESLNLSIWNLSDEELESLGLVLNLKRLTLKLKIRRIGFKSEALNGFLSSQSKTLEYLKLFDSEHENIEFAYEFPRMESLKVFDIHSRICRNMLISHMDWNKSFPKLETLKLRDAELLPPNTRSELLGLKILDLTRGIGRSLSNLLPVVGQIFPNVHTIKIEIYSDDFLNTVLSDAFPNLKKVIFRGGWYERSVEKVKNRLNGFVWDLNLNSRDLAVVKMHLTRLTETGFEVKEYMRGVGGSWKTYDCTWFLRLLRQRIQLEQLDEELKVDMEMKKGFADLNLDSDDGK